MRINSKEIAIPDGEIGEQAGSDQAEARLVEARIGALARIAPHRLAEGDALFGMPPLRILAVPRFAIDRGVEPGEGVDGRHRPVGPHADMRARADARAIGEAGLTPFLPDPAPHPAPVAVPMLRLDQPQHA